MRRRRTAWRLNVQNASSMTPSGTNAARQQVKRLVRNPPRPVIEEDRGEPVSSWTYDPVVEENLKAASITPVPAERGSWRRSLPSPHVF